MSMNKCKVPSIKGGDNFDDALISGSGAFVLMLRMCACNRGKKQNGVQPNTSYVLVSRTRERYFERGARVKD